MNHISLKFFLFLLLIGIGTMFFSTTIRADSFTWNETRDLQSIVIQADSIPGLIGTSISQIFLYGYIDLTQTWVQVPFQIDEKGWEDDSSRTFFGAKDGILESGDEICFMAKDMGDMASIANWVSNHESKRFPRFELSASDPLEPGKKRYLYLYISTTLNPIPFEGWVKYIEASSDTTGNDTIEAKGYIEGHDSSRGIVDYWSVPFAAGGSEVDFLDRIKYRVNLDLGFFKPKFTEDKALKLKRIRYVEGLVRIIREIEYWLVYPIFPDPIDSTSFVTYYYPYHLDSRGPSKKLNADLGINYIRQSFDLNENAIGMTIYNPYNSGIVVDGDITNDNFVKTVADYPQMNWHLVTGSPGSFLMLYVLPDIGDSRELYYYDSAAGGTADETEETGDSQSYGDLGMAILGTRIAGSFGMSYVAYFIEADKDPIIGQSFLSSHENPLSIHATMQSYDSPPGRITDLQVVDFTIQSITLRWTAPGDDEYGGEKVKAYDLRYSKNPVVGDTLQWWNAASMPAENPAALDPGQTQFFAITGLDAYTNYYFVMRSQDDSGHISSFSNVASGTSYPVELITFNVSIENADVVLRWETASENNNVGFEIQRSDLNASGEWIKIGFVEGFGTTNTHHDYVFVDRSVESGEYEYRLKQIDSDGSFSYSNTVRIGLTVPGVFALHQNYPNPFNSETVISYQIAKTSQDVLPVQLVIYSVTGAEIQTLINQKQAAGTYRLNWNGRDSQGDFVSAGIYLLRLRAGDFVESKKMLLIK